MDYQFTFIIVFHIILIRRTVRIYSNLTTFASSSFIRHLYYYIIIQNT